MNSSGCPKRTVHPCLSYNNVHVPGCKQQILRILQEPRQEIAVEQKAKRRITVQVSEFVRNVCVYIVLLLFCAVFEDTSLTFFKAYYVNSNVCVRNSLSNIVVKAKYMGTIAKNNGRWYVSICDYRPELNFQRLEHEAEPGAHEMPSPCSPGASLHVQPLARGSASICAIACRIGLTQILAGTTVGLNWM